ncbi:MAG TPA: YihY/virulence factor BrkB family protein [Acidimicrobiales bacterium]|nr:YihY/virulence factor BrkB family protein [Acidimicrobiales bacterium]
MPGPGKSADKEARVASGGTIGELLGGALAAIAVGAAGAKAVRDRVRAREGSPAAPADRVVDLRVPDVAEGTDHERAEAKPGGFKAKLVATGERFKPLGVALKLQERYGDLHGNNLAASVTFSAFVSLLPLLLVIVSIVGFIAGGGTDVAGRIIGELGLTGDAATAVTDAVEAAEGSKRVAGPIGLAGLLWSGLGLVAALQYAYNQVWQVEERGIKDKAVGILWLGGAAVLFVGAAAITTVLRWLPGALAPLGIVVALAVNLALWIWTSKVLPNTDLPVRAVLPGAIFAAIGFEVLKALGAYYVPRTVANSSQLYGSLGVVFAILAWLFFFGRLIVYSAVLNVVMWERKEGTVTVVTQVPRQPGADRGEEVTRMGRLEHA